MKNKEKESRQNDTNFKSVEFMRSARQRLTEKYQQNREAFLKEIEQATEEFLKVRKNKPIKRIAA